jgi:hypothetical protein
MAMFTDEKAIEILTKLLEKTRARQVNWQAGAPDEEPTNFDEVTSFFLELPHSRVLISLESPLVEIDWIDVVFKNKEGVSVKRIVVDEEDPNWPLVQSLYQEAGRITIGWDTVLNDLENAVQSQDKIGIATENIEY